METKRKTIKVFISQPMNGLSDTQIIEKRKEAEELIKKALSKRFPKSKIKFVDSFYVSDRQKKPLYFLAKSLMVLSKADMIYFVDGWREEQKCLAENYCAIAYRVPALRIV